MSNTFSSDIVGPSYFWHGQVVDDSNWYENINPKLHSRDDVPGWGFRYKIRIFGRDVKAKSAVSDDQLDWATVLLPVTAGSGHAGSVQTPNIRQGNYVMGYYEDGIVATKPVILFVYPNHSQTRLFGGDTQENFIPRSGYKGKGGDKPVSTKNIYSEGPGSPPIQENADQNQDTINKIDQQKDGSRCHYVPKTRACDGPSGELKGIQRHIKNLISFINRIRSESDSFIGAASDLVGQIPSLIDEISIFIASLLKTLIDKIRAFVVNKLEKGINDLMENLAPNERATANEASEKAADILQCVFNKIIKGLLSLVKNLLNDIIDKYINTPMCAVEGFIGSFLSTILGDITSGVQNAVDAVQGTLGKISDISGQIFNALDTFIGVLKFLSCEEDLDCTMGDQWSFWGGAKCEGEKVRAGIGSFLRGVVSGIAGGESSPAPPCNTSAITCGPPSISIQGGGGFGAIGNPIISPTGAILGIDFVNGGSGYISPPTINIIDKCGIGGGAVIIPIIDTETGTSLDDINTGFNDEELSATDRLSIRSNNTVSVGSSDGSFTRVGSAFTGIGTYIRSRTFLRGGISTAIGFQNQTFTVKVGDLPLKIGSSDGTPLLINGQTVSSGGDGGTPLTINNTQVFAGATGGIPLNVESSGGTPVVIFDKPLNVGGYPVTYGGVGGNSVVAGNQGVSIGGTGGIPVNINATGGTPLRVKDNRVKLGGDNLEYNGEQLNVGGSDGTALVLGGTGTPIRTNKGPLSVNSTGGSKLFFGDKPVTVDGFQVIVGGNGGDPIRESEDSTGLIKQTLVDDNNFRLSIGGNGGTPILINGSPINIDGKTLNSGSKGGTPIEIGGNGEVIKTNNGTPLTIGGSGGFPATVNNSPITIGGEYVSVGSIGGSPLTYNSTKIGGSIVGSIVLDPGVGYLSTPNGDLGGNGTIWAPKNTTVIQRSDGTYDTPYYPGSTIEVLPGDSVKYPGQAPKLINLPQTIIAPDYPNIPNKVTGGNLVFANDTQVFVGKTPVVSGGTGGIPITSGGSGGLPVTSGGLNVTAGGTGGIPVTSNGKQLTSGGLPVVAGGNGGSPLAAGGTGGIEVTVGSEKVTTGSDGQSSTPSSTYPVVLKLRAVLVTNPGIAYLPTDKIKITPDHGAVLEPKYDKQGRVIKVSVINPGIGFVDYPKITIESEQGINAQMIPVFDIIRIGDLSEDQVIVPPGTNIISVVDCVGKFN
jgi:hypothetical protein